MGTIRVPLKFKDGLVRNLDGLTKNFTDSPQDIIRFIAGGELEKFFEERCEENLKQLIVSLKTEGMPPAEIAHELAKALGVSFVEGAAFVGGDEIIGHHADLKSLLEGEAGVLHFIKGEWKSEDTVAIKSAKQISGQGSTQTVLYVNEIVIDNLSDAPIAFKNLSLRNAANKEGVIRVFNGEVQFKDISFEGIRLETANRSTIKLKSCSIASDIASKPSTAIIILDDAVVDIGNKTQFENIETPILVETKEFSFPIDKKAIEKYGKALNYRFDKSSRDELIREGALSLGDYLKVVRHFKKSGIMVLKEPLIIDGDDFTIEGCGELVIETDMRRAIVVNQGVLNLRNIKLRYTGIKAPLSDAKDEDKVGLIDVIDGALNMDSCNIEGSGFYGIRSSGSHLTFSKSKIVRTNAEGIVIDSSSAALVDCIVTQSGASGHEQIWAKNNSVLTLENTIISDSGGGTGIHSVDSKLNISAGCKVINNGENGINIKGGTAKITDCEISKNGKEGQTYAQIYIGDKTEVTIENTMVSYSRGGSGINTEGSKLNISGSKIVGNGYGLWVRSAEYPHVVIVVIKDCEITYNEKGGIFIENNESGVKLEIKYTAIGDTIKGSGIQFDTGVIAFRSELKISGSRILNNAEWGIWINKKAEVEIIGCEFKGNKSGNIFKEEGVFVSPTVIEKDNKYL